MKSTLEIDVFEIFSTPSTVLGVMTNRTSNGSGHERGRVEGFKRLRAGEPHEPLDTEPTFS
jgi:hypothetical protein